MQTETNIIRTWPRRIRSILIGRARDPEDRHIAHKLALGAFFAWVGLGSDGLSSSCYGPEEAFLALGQHHSLAIFVALASAVTIIVISASYSQIIELFPSGGGGYLVASKLLSPTVGMISGCALLIDYVLTITISIASGADALFSFLSLDWQPYKNAFAFAAVIALIVMNLRGVKESVVPLVPVFLLFLLTHGVLIAYSAMTHLGSFSTLAANTWHETQATHASLGSIGMMVLLLRAFSMGAGTFTGIEAISNGLPLLREPKVHTARKTMAYMAASLALVSTGLMLSYLLFKLVPAEGRTLNAVLLERATGGWKAAWRDGFVGITLLVEAALLLIAAQTGFLDGPRVLANMASDRWFPARFANLSDRLVTQNGIMLMGGAALVTMWLTGASVRLLVVLYSINVFITFVLSQLGMIRHWLQVRRGSPTWKRALAINGSSFLVTAFILVALISLKFNEGGWITMVITTCVILFALAVRRHYHKTVRLLDRLDDLMVRAADIVNKGAAAATPERDPTSKTAVVFVNGFNGLGLHTLLNITKLFGTLFRNYVFVQVGVIDAGNFKGAGEVDALRRHVEGELDRYVSFVAGQGLFGRAVAAVGTDIVDEAERLAAVISAEQPGCVFFGGQLVFARESWFTRALHNYVVFAIQRRLYGKGLPFVVLPIRV